MEISRAEIRTALYAAVGETLEGMAFLELMLNAEPVERFKDNFEWLWSSIALLEPLCGELYIICPKTMAPLIGDSVYGTPDGSVNESQIFDVMGELANTAAGRFMNLAIPEDHPFSLGLPRTGEGWPADSEFEICSLATDEGQRLIAALKLKKI